MIHVSDLRFSYPRAEGEALRGLCFEIAPGEIFGFLGPSGAGKSTLQNILTGLLKGYRGGARVLGRDLSAWGSDYYERIGVAFELPTHFRRLTAAENLAYFAALYRRRALAPREALALVGLGEAADTPVAEFSKGMQNRLSVARALLHGPELLFLDEPTSGLDPVNARRIKALVEGQRAAGATVVLTTHNMAVAEELCDRVAFIVDGAIRLIDTPRALKLRYGQSSVLVEYAEGGGATRACFPLDGLGENPGFLGLLRGGAVQTIHSQEASLEEIFVRVTGRSLS
ncbi:MAG TPA: ABC transporter ATP-binding protein [Roseiflexaceae bacterium]|nr:ABC transporter ATP-binding protein [Roseiflexaceae bacterium]